MQNPIPSCAGFRRAASCALRFAISGTGTVLTGTGTALVCTGLALQFWGRKLKSSAESPVRPQPKSNRRMRAVPQPA